MRRSIIFSLFISIVTSVNAQTANLNGTVLNKAEKPIAKAIVTLMGKGLNDTTGSDGKFSIPVPVTRVLPFLIAQTENITLNRGVLEISLTSPSTVKIEIVDVKGNLLKRELLEDASNGVYRLNIAENSRAANLLVINASIGRRMMTFRYLPLHNGKYAVNSSVGSCSPMGGRVARIAAISDSLKVTADGYMTKVVKITSYDTAVTIILDSAGGTVSAGCGKTPPASGVKATIDVDGTKREYLLKLPSNYDPSKPYKLIFCPHWMGGKIEDVVNGSACGGPYYGLEKLANGTAIFVVPQGLSSGGSTGFPNTNGQDVKFFEALLKYCNSTMCIDQKRIFSVGFSYGGMMSFAVGCAMWDKFRAIAPMSGAFYSGCDKSRQGPIAVWQAHGKSDPVVKLNDGIAARDYFLERNGCGKETKKVDPDPCVAYQGCKEGYPVTYCEFNGGHGVQSFAAAAIWNFFSQF